MTPQLVHVTAERDDSLTLGIQHTEPDGGSRSFDPGYVTVLVTTGPTPAGPDDQPVLLVYGVGTQPIVRIALRDRLVATGWEPFA